MRSVSLRLVDLERKPLIPLGFEGENEYMTINFDCKTVFDKHPAAVPTLAVTPPQGDSYPAVVVRDGDIVSWTVCDSDLVCSGEGVLQLTFVDGTIIGKTYKARTKVLDSITPSGEAPTPIQNWLIQAAAALQALPQEVSNAVVALMGAMVGVGETLGPGENVTVSYDVENNTLTIGVPRGADGHSPVITADKVDKTTTIYVDDIAIATINDGDGSNVIDDTAGEGDTDKVWSADKSHELLTEINSTSEVVDEISQRGKNLFDKDNVDYVVGYMTNPNQSSGSISSSSGARTIYIPCLPSTTYTMSKTLSKRFIFGYTDVLPVVGCNVPYAKSNNNQASLTITTGENAKYLVAFVYLSSADTLTFAEISDTIQIEAASSASSYEPYILTAVDKQNRKTVENLQKGMEILATNRATVLGEELFSNFSGMTAENGAVYEDDVWKIPVGGGISGSVDVENYKTYYVSIGVVFGSQVIPDVSTSTVDVKTMTVTFGTESIDIFAFIDGNFNLTFPAHTTGSVGIEIVCNDLSLNIESLSIKKVVSYPDIPLKLNEVSMVSAPANNSVAFGNGQKKSVNADINTAFGYMAQNDVSTGYANTGVGFGAQHNLTVGRGNTAVGNGSQVHMKQGMYNCAVGTATQKELTTGSWNCAMGNEAQMDATEACNNVGIGRRAQSYLSTGKMNVAVGAFAGFAQHGMNNTQGDYGTKTASYQTLVGGEAIQGATTPQDYATTLGYKTMANEKAVALGAKSKALGEKSVAIGYGVEVSNDDEVAIGDQNATIVLAGHTITFNQDGTVTWN